MDSEQITPSVRPTRPPTLAVEVGTRYEDVPIVLAPNRDLNDRRDLIVTDDLTVRVIEGAPGAPARSADVLPWENALAEVVVPRHAAIVQECDIWPLEGGADEARPVPAELSWRISWLAGTAVAHTEGATWTPPEPAPGPVEAAAGRMSAAIRASGGTVDELAGALQRSVEELAPARRSMYAQSIRVQLHTEQQIAAGVPPATVLVVREPGSVAEQVNRMMLSDRVAASRRRHAG